MSISSQKKQAILASFLLITLIIIGSAIWLSTASSAPAFQMIRLPITDTVVVERKPLGMWLDWPGWRIHLPLDEAQASLRGSDDQVLFGVLQAFSRKDLDAYVALSMEDPQILAKHFDLLEKIAGNSDQVRIEMKFLTSYGVLYMVRFTDNGPPVAYSLRNESGDWKCDMLASLEDPASQVVIMGATSLLTNHVIVPERWDGQSVVLDTGIKIPSAKSVVGSFLFRGKHTSCVIDKGKVAIDEPDEEIRKSLELYARIAVAGETGDDETYLASLTERHRKSVETMREKLGSQPFAKGNYTAVEYVIVGDDVSFLISRWTRNRSPDNNTSSPFTVVIRHMPDGTRLWDGATPGATSQLMRWDQFKRAFFEQHLHPRVN